MIPRADPLMREIVKPEVKRFIEFCRRRNAAHQVKSIAKPRAPKVTEATARLFAWMQENPTPATVFDLAAATGLSEYTVRDILSKHKSRFAEGGMAAPRGKTKRLKLWRLVDGDSG